MDEEAEETHTVKFVVVFFVVGLKSIWPVQIITWHSGPVDLQNRHLALKPKSLFNVPVVRFLVKTDRGISWWHLFYSKIVCYTLKSRLNMMPAGLISLQYKDAFSHVFLAEPLCIIA